MDNVVDFPGELQKRRVPQVTEATGNTEYVLEVEHELLETQMQVCSLHRDLERMRRALEKMKRELADARRAGRSKQACQ